MTDQETQETELEVVRRRRAAAAFILITASLSVGILIGRLSATLVSSDAPRPTANAAGAGRTSQPAKPVVAAAEPTPAAQPAPQPAKPVDTAQPPKLEITKDLSAVAPASPAQVAVAAVGNTEPAASADVGDIQSNDDKVTVINPRGSETAPPPSRETAPPPNRPRIASERASVDSPRGVADARRNDARASGVEECERRYSSFRREDGTYQPYGSGTRIRCPHLR